jgi:hypothetical protein
MNFLFQGRKRGGAADGALNVRFRDLREAQAHGGGPRVFGVLRPLSQNGLAHEWTMEYNRS